MAHTSKDKTLIDNNRRELSFSDHHNIREVLPEYFLESFPNLITFLEAYYEFEDDPSSPAHLIHELFITRDITATDLKLLGYIEDELLLGQQYFSGFKNKRAAAKYSNVLYRSKGTLFSMQQFFRAFFGVIPEIIYTKQFIFSLNDSKSKIGVDSGKFLQDNKLYQNFALLIKAPIPTNVWKEAYKLFVHPAGMYLGTEIQLTGSGLITGTAPIALPTSLNPVVLAAATITFSGLTEITGLWKKDETSSSDPDEMYRIKLPNKISSIENYTIEQLDRTYDDLGELIGQNSPTLDEDSDGADFRVARISSDLDTMDEVKYEWYDPR